MILGASLAILAVCGVVYYVNQSAASGRPAEKATVNASYENEGAKPQPDAASGLSSAAGTEGSGQAAGAGETAAGTLTDPGALAGADPSTASVDVPSAPGNAGQAAVPGRGRTAADLNFWNMYPEEPAQEIPEEKLEEAEAEEVDPSTDGKHTLVVSPTGEEEWVLINPYLKKNTYDLTRFTARDNLMHYYENGRQSSFVGIDINEYNDEVNFPGLKEEGIDFVMLRAGVRGYESGSILQDKALADNLVKAKEAGIRIGLYFSSQAITREEAVEEAEFCLNFAREAALTYPIAYVLEDTQGTSSRAQNLRKDERTNNAAAFCEAIRTAGFVPMIYGDKFFLLKQIDLARLSDYEIWYSDASDLPDYPYQYSMWQYSQTASLKNAKGVLDLNICFVNYEER